MVTIIELPDNVTGAAPALSIAASGMVNARTTALLTVQEVDRAIGNRASLLPRSGDFSLYAGPRRRL